jgi:hypothetical protein
MIIKGSKFYIFENKPVLKLDVKFNSLDHAKEEVLTKAKELLVVLGYESEIRNIRITNWIEIPPDTVDEVYTVICSFANN